MTDTDYIKHVFSYKYPLYNIELVQSAYNNFYDFCLIRFIDSRRFYFSYLINRTEGRILIYLPWED